MLLTVMGVQVPTRIPQPSRPGVPVKVI